MQGSYTKFWGSLEWEIKIDFDFELMNNFLITFKNRNQLENTFGVNDLCSVAHLFMRTLNLDEKFGDKLAVTRLSNFIAEYLGKYLAPVKPDDVANCLGFKKDRVHVKVKKMTTTDFYDALDFDEDDLSIDFQQYYNELSNIIIIEQENELQVIDHAKYFKQICNNYQILLQSKYMLSGKEEINKKLEILSETEQWNVFTFDYTIINENSSEIEEVELIVNIPPGLHLNDIRAKIYAPDNSELGVFQPTDIRVAESNNIQVCWQIENLKPMHSIIFSHNLSKRILHLISVLKNNKNIHIINCSDLKISDSDEHYRSISFPVLEELSQDETINDFVSILPSEIYFENESSIKNEIESEFLSEEYRSITWSRKFIEQNAKQPNMSEIVFLDKEEISLSIEENKEKGEGLIDEIEEIIIADEDALEINSPKEDDRFGDSLELQDERVKFEEFTKEYRKEEYISVEPEEIYTNYEPVLLYDSQKIIKNFAEIEELYLMLRLLVPEGERFIVILMNPFEMVAAHIEGGSVKEQQFRKFKLPLIKIKGNWVLKIQFLEKQIGSTTEYKLKIK